MNRLTLFLASLFTLTATAQQLPTHPDLVTGTLDNGMDYILLEHDNPKDRVSVYLHIETGSLNEQEHQRGIAHYLEHMAFNGGNNFPPGEVVPFFESLGLTFGRHQNAFTSFDQTVYILNLPDAQADTLDKGLMFFEDVAFGLLLEQKEIDEERGVILEEKASRKGPQMRVQEKLWEQIAPGSTFGRRMPIGVDETLNAINRDDFVDYWGKWYVPANMTVIIVGDLSTDTMRELVMKRLDKFREGDAKADAPAPLPVGIEPYTENRAIVITDPELTDGNVWLVGVQEPKPPVVTVEDFERVVRERIAQTAFNRRMSAKINEDKVSFDSGTASTFDLFGAMRLAFAGASGEPGEWNEMLTDMAAELRRARLHGFSQREVDDARASVMSGFERAAEAEPTMPASAILGSINNAVNDGSAMTSAAYDLELAQKVLPTITPEMVGQTFNELFPDSKIALVLTLPESTEVASESELLEITAQALSATPEPDEEVERPDQLMAELPEPGETVEITNHEQSGITSAWLSNNTRIHYRYMDKRADQATIRITLAGGSIYEDDDTRGLSDAAANAWDNPATQRLSSTNIRDLTTGKKVTVSGSIGSDTMTLTVSGNPDDFDTGMQLAHLLITEPFLEDAALNRWRTQELQAIEQRRLVPLSQIQEAIAEALIDPSEVRLYPLTKEQVDRITAEDAQAWLERLLDGAPIEVSVVGDIDKERAFELIERYIGSLETRPRISDDLFADLRDVKRSQGERLVERRIKTQTPLAISVSGSFGPPPGPEHMRDRRLVRMATNILSTRMIKRLREEEQLVYSIGANAASPPTYPKMSMIVAGAPTQPGKENVLADSIHEMFAEFAESGPSDEEVTVARDQIANAMNEEMEQPNWWNGIMSDMTYRGTDLDDVLDWEGQYGSFAGDEIREAFSRYYTDENKWTVIIAPQTEEAPSEAGDAIDPATGDEAEGAPGDG